MDIPEQCLWFCGHVTALTGVHCTLLNILTKDFAIPPFQNGCALDAGDCSASHTHLYGTYEAQRWAGKYIYYCPRGLVFCAVIPQMCITDWPADARATGRALHDYRPGHHDQQPGGPV